VRATIKLPGGRRTTELLEERSAVVAEEVRQLAAQSGEASREAGGLV